MMQTFMLKRGFLSNDPVSWSKYSFIIGILKLKIGERFGKEYRMIDDIQF